ncbi:MAG: hypothetical protein LBK42_09390, partial [Propionibacteriaceae bacterium]|nr:hypothetical protein [Propionibacteriaceae bacterium]
GLRGAAVTDVNINIEAMRAMLNGLHKARDNVTNLRSDLDTLLNKVAGWPRVHADRPVEASTGRLNDVLFWIDDSIPDINRRLALAVDVASATPSFRPGDTVWIDDDRITGLSTWQAGARGREIAQLLADGQMTDQDWDDLAALATDPYFAVALANHCPPETLAQTALGLSDQYQTRLRDQGDEYAAYQARGGDQALTDWAAGQADAYQRRLESLGTVLGAATRTGQLRQGYADQVVAVFQQQGPLPAAMGAVLGYGAYSTGFAYTVAAGVYDYERGDDFPGTWSQGVAAGTGFTLPDGSHLTDPLPGVMAMLSTDHDAARQFFGDSERLRYLIVDRTWAAGRGSDEGDGLCRALESACVPCWTGLGRISAADLSDRIINIVQEAERDTPGWHVSTGMRDSITTIMERRLAGTLILGNTVWPTELPADFLDVRAQIEDQLMGALADSGLTPAQQWQSINYIAYRLDTAPEPYRTRYLEDIGQVNIRHATKDQFTGTSRYLSIGPLNDIAVNFFNAFSDPREPFFVLFHELGHGIDDVDEPFGVETNDYVYNGETINDALVADVRANLIAAVFDPTVAVTTGPAQRQRVVDAIMAHTTANLRDADKIVLFDLQKHYSSVLGSPAANVASDIYGAVTGNVILGGYSHSENYWANNSDAGPSEFWAGYAADHVVGGDGQSLTEEYLPTATDVANHMADELG